MITTLNGLNGLNTRLIKRKTITRKKANKKVVSNWSRFLERKQG